MQIPPPTHPSTHPPVLIHLPPPTTIPLRSLTDKNHNVLLGGVCLVCAVLEISPALAPKFTRLVPALVKILRKLITAGYAPEYDVGGVTDPFLQVRAWEGEGEGGGGGGGGRRAGG